MRRKEITYEMGDLNLTKPPPHQVKNPLTILTLPRSYQLNQPHVTEVVSHAEARTTTSSRFLPDTLSSSMSRADYLVEMREDSEARDLGGMFATYCRTLANRNRFAQFVFFILGILMCMCMIFYFVIIYQERVMEDFKKNFIVLGVLFACILIIIMGALLSCSRWLRGRPQLIITLILADISVCVFFGSVSAHFGVTTTFLYLSASLMIVFLVASILASQRKWEMVSTPMMIFLIGVSFAVSCFSLLTVDKPSWLVSHSWRSAGISSALTIICTLFVTFLIRDMVYGRDMRIHDFIFGGLISFMSITTPYAIYAFFTLFRKKLPQERGEREAREASISFGQGQSSGYARRY